MKVKKWPVPKKFISKAKLLLWHHKKVLSWRKKNPPEEKDYSRVRESFATKILVNLKIFCHNSCLNRNQKIKIRNMTEVIFCDIISTRDKKYKALMDEYKNIKKPYESLQTYCRGLEKQVKAAKVSVTGVIYDDLGQ